VSGPEALRVDALARLEVIADTYLSMSAPIQWAMPALLGQRHAFQKQVIDRVSENLSELDKQLARQKSCSRLEVEGGWNAVIRVTATRSDEELALELLATQGVYIHPGHFYDFPAEGYLVASLISLPIEFAQGMKILLSMF